MANYSDDDNLSERPSPTAKFQFTRGVTLSPLNPGNIANLHKKTRDIVPEWIEGLRVQCATNLDTNRAINMEWLMGNCVPYGFRFGGMICRKDCHDGSITRTPILVGDTNPSTLATNFHFLYHPFSQIKLETRIQASGLRNSADLGDIISTAEYLGKSSTISLALYNPKFETGRMTIGFLHSFNNNFCAGAELLSEWTGNQVHNNLAIAMRYSQRKSSIAATVSKDILDISAWHQSNDLLQLGASLILNKCIARSLASFYYQIETKDCVIKAMIDTKWTVGCTYKRQLKNFPTAVGFSILYCIPKNKFHCGLNFELNSNFK
ncbi:hypothetical protein PVAND_011247 [Polypedilum vanderplanki]|uniref:Uncharacterized protein n=1 Tax=Polypedilum vanderplanki TaxID=319348 RepID=A0A9J6CIZ0_POLVA|nr:hypothetical protein PVAND_011247 [Polypedilum vanderplanki]